MKKSLIYSVWLLIVGFSMMSINCHEVIPAPVDYGPPVQLDCEFTGQIMGSSDTVMVQMNDGSITCTSTSVKNIVTNGVSEARYSSLITSPNTGEQLTLNIGAVNWVGGNTPDTAAFLSFFSQDSTRLFDNTTAAGVSMIFRDSVGNFWTSQDTVVTFTNSFRFTSLNSDQDTTGLYQLYEALSSCVLYDNAGNDSIVLNGGFIKGHFKYE